jgi:adenylate cyclase
VLRKTLGREYVLTDPGRGYRFVGVVEHLQVGVAPAGIASVALLPPRKPSIAVLPFTNMSGDPEQEYFSDGISEDIITALARFPSLFVIARNSTFTYKGRAVDINQVGIDLGVRYVLEGSVRKADSRVRISGKLAQTGDRAQLWAERYDRNLGDIFALQDEMTANIVGALVPTLQRAEVDRARSRAPESLDAYDLYLRALAAFHAWTREGNDQALQLLDRALALDPKYTAAVILAENCWVHRFGQAWSPVPEAIAESTRLARPAFQLDPDNADALAVLARRTSTINQDYEEATALAARAVEINPNSAFAWRHGGYSFVFAGRSEEALTYFNRALRLDPRDPRAHDCLIGIALALIQLERDADAIATARKAIQLYPNYAAAWRMLTAGLTLTGRLDEAREALRRVLELDPNCTLKTLYLRFGHSETARARFYDGLRQAGMPEN